jgi:acyl carrier protein
MKAPQTLDRVQRLVARRLEIDASRIAPESTLESLGIDSLATLELLFDLEEEFGMRLEHDHRRIATLGDLVAVIESNLAREFTAAA